MNEVEHLRKEFRDKENLTIFDIGACNFRESMGFKEAFPKADVYAFESDIDNLASYSQAAISRGVKVLPVALYDQDSEETFYPSDTNKGETWRYSGSLIKPATKEGTAEGINHPGLFFNLEGYKVTTKRFDTFCKENNILNVDYIHIDVQGAEMKVLSALGNIRPKLIFAETCEFTTYKTGITLDVFDIFMVELGYEIEARYEFDTLYKLVNAE